MSRPLCTGDGEVDEERWNPDEPPHPVLPGFMPYPAWQSGT